jgi:hypothetical protein
VRIPDVLDTTTDYTVEYLEALEQEHPELGRLEVIDGGLHATGTSAVGRIHQLIVQRLYLLLAPLCPPQHVLMLDTWWFSRRGKIRADVGVYRPEDFQAPGKVFWDAPQAIIEVLSADRHHDLVRKDDIYAEFGVRRTFIDPEAIEGWWAQVDGIPVEGPTASLEWPGWPPVTLNRATLLDPDPTRR